MAYGLEYLERALTFMQSRSARDKAAARIVVAELNARDVVHAQHCSEHCRGTYESVRGLRQAINTQLGKEMSTDLAFVFRELEMACREYVRAMEQAGLDEKHYLSAGSPEMETFSELLGEFQHSVQRIGERLAANYNIVLP
jgi:hypothetical protein